MDDLIAWEYGLATGGRPKSYVFADRQLSSRESASPAVGLLRRPGAVVLLDEVNRAHRFVRGLLYQPQEGRITTLEGTTVSSVNATVIMSTNAGARGVPTAVHVAPAVPATRPTAEQDRAQPLGRRRALGRLGPGGVRIESGRWK